MTPGEFRTTLTRLGLTHTGAAKALDVSDRTIEIHLGAVLQGRLLHEDEVRSEKVVQFKPATAE